MKSKLVKTLLERMTCTVGDKCVYAMYNIWSEHPINSCTKNMDTNYNIYLIHAKYLHILDII